MRPARLFQQLDEGAGWYKKLGVAVGAIGLLGALLAALIGGAGTVRGWVSPPPAPDEALSQACRSVAAAYSAMIPTAFDPDDRTKEQAFQRAAGALSATSSASRNKTVASLGRHLQFEAERNSVTYGDNNELSRYNISATFAEYEFACQQAGEATNLSSRVLDAGLTREDHGLCYTAQSMVQYAFLAEDLKRAGLRHRTDAVNRLIKVLARKLVSDVEGLSDGSSLAPNMKAFGNAWVNGFPPTEPRSWAVAIIDCYNAGYKGGWDPGETVLVPRRIK